MKEEDSHYKKLKVKLKELFEKNNKLIDLAIRAKKKISRLRKEKEILIDKIAQYELDMPSELTCEDGKIKEDVKSDLDKKEETVSSEDELNIHDKALLESDMKDTNKTMYKNKKNKRRTSTGQKRKRVSKGEEEKTDAMDGEEKTSTEQKKRKSSRQSNDARKIQDIPKDETGRPLLPAKVGPLTLIQLGTIVYDREKFHNSRYIWPVGFESTRSYYSMKSPDRHIIYRSRILDGGDGPIFQVTPEDDPENPVTAPAASTTWTSIMRKVNESKNKGQSCSASGPEYFGFGNPTIVRLIQEMPNADKCKNYIMQHHEPAATEVPIPATAPTPPENASTPIKEVNKSDLSMQPDIEMKNESTHSQEPKDLVQEISKDPKDHEEVSNEALPLETKSPMVLLSEIEQL